MQMNTQYASVASLTLSQALMSDAYGHTCRMPCLFFYGFVMVVRPSGQCQLYRLHVVVVLWCVQLACACSAASVVISVIARSVACNLNMDYHTSSRAE